MTKIKLLITNPNGKYFPGNVIQGRCCVEVDNKIHFQTFYIELCGRAMTHWTEGSGSDSTSYSNTHEIVDTKHTFLVSNDQSMHEAITLQSGTHEYPFLMPIPYGDLPSSFKGPFGNIIYTLKAKIVRKLLPNIKVSHELTIFNPASSLHPVLMEPIEQRQEQQAMTFCCIRSGLVCLSLRLNKTAFQCGEDIHFTFNTTNNTSKSIQPKVGIAQVNTYYAGKFKKTRHTIECLRGPMFNGVEISWSEVLKVPQLKDLSILNCPNIRLEFEVVGTLNISGASKVRIHQAIVVGLPIPYALDIPQGSLVVRHPCHIPSTSNT